jgi:hypothetical protein
MHNIRYSTRECYIGGGVVERRAGTGERETRYMYISLSLVPPCCRNHFTRLGNLDISGSMMSTLLVAAPPRVADSSAMIDVDP